MDPLAFCHCFAVNPTDTSLGEMLSCASRALFCLFAGVPARLKPCTGADLLNSGRATEASCVILDVRMPDLNGLQLQRRLKEIRSSIPMIFFSAHAGKEEEDQALRSGAVAFLRKPVHRHDLLRVIRMALERKS
jgi:FixJ family two-component response regulator